MFKEGQQVEVVGTNTEHDGKIWVVIGKAPNKMFKLPNGRKHAKPNSDDSWIVQMDAPIHVPTTIIGSELWTNQFTNNYGVCDSKFLRALGWKTTNPTNGIQDFTHPLYAASKGVKDDE